MILSERLVCLYAVHNWVTVSVTRQQIIVSFNSEVSTLILSHVKFKTTSFPINTTLDNT